MIKWVKPWDASEFQKTASTLTGFILEVIDLDVLAYHLQFLWFQIYFKSLIVFHDDIQKDVTSTCSLNDMKYLFPRVDTI